MAIWSKMLHRYGIFVLGLVMFGFEGDEPSVFDETLRFNTVDSLQLTSSVRSIGVKPEPFYLAASFAYQ